MAEMVKCPRCGHEFELSEILTHQIEESLKAELEKGVKKRESLLEARNKELLLKEKEIEEGKENLEGLVKERLDKELEKHKKKTEKELSEKMLPSVLPKLLLIL